jgi:hypothetical protein
MKHAWFCCSNFAALPRHGILRALISIAPGVSAQLWFLRCLAKIFLRRAGRLPLPTAFLSPFLVLGPMTGLRGRLTVAMLPSPIRIGSIPVFGQCSVRRWDSIPALRSVPVILSFSISWSAKALLLASFPSVLNSSSASFFYCCQLCTRF